MSLYEAGRELDALVHLVVMEAPEVCKLVGAGTLYDPIRLAPPGAAYRVRSEVDHYWERWSPNGDSRIVNDSVPRYSTDIAAAWRVVAKLRDDGWWFALKQDNTDIWDACFWRGEPRGWFPTVEARGCSHNNSAPLAICRAALPATTETPLHGKPAVEGASLAPNAETTP